MPEATLPPHVPIQTRAYRATSYDVPLRVAANRRSGRWNIARSSTVQYLCLDAEAPFAEKLRHENLRTQAEAASYSVTLWELEVNEGVVVDYSTFEKAEDAGFPPGALVDDDHEWCQKEAQRLMKEHQVPVVLEFILERVTNISMGTEIDKITEFEELAERNEDAPTAIMMLD